MNKKHIAYFYFISFIVIGALFGLNLLIGIIFSNFISLKKTAESKNLSENQMDWIKMHEIILKSTPFSFSIPNKGVKKKILDLLNSKACNYFLSLILLIDFILLMLYFDAISHKNLKILEFLKMGITFFYFLEFILKLIALAPKTYFSYFWYKLEFFIVICYVFYDFFNVVIFKYSNSKKSNTIFFFYFKILRIMGVLRLFKKMKRFETMLKTLIFTIPLILNMLVLFIINLLIYSVIGCFLFKNVKSGYIINEFVNFKNIINSIGILIKSSLSDDWQYIMFDVSKFEDCTPNYDCGSS